MVHRGFRYMSQRMFIGGVKYMAHQSEETDEFEDGTKEPSNLISAIDVVFPVFERAPGLTLRGHPRSNLEHGKCWSSPSLVPTFVDSCLAYLHSGE